MPLRRITTVLAALVLGAVGALVTATPASAQTVGVLTTTLSGAAERPVPGDPDATGSAVFVLLPEQQLVCYVLTVQGIDPATAAHVHVAPPTEAGPVVLPLEPPTSGVSGGCTSASTALIRAILSDPARYYVNVHNTPYPGGAARGQLG